MQAGAMLIIPKFSFNSKNDLAYKTFITQEMLKRGYLATNSIYVSTAHSEKIIIKSKCRIEKENYNYEELARNINSFTYQQ